MFCAPLFVFSSFSFYWPLLLYFFGLTDMYYPYGIFKSFISPVFCLIYVICVWLRIVVPNI